MVSILVAVGLSSLVAQSFALASNGPRDEASPLATTTQTPSYSYGTFAYMQMSTDRYATPLPSPLSLTTFAPPFSHVSTLLPTAVVYTTFSLNRSATLVEDGPYGQSAYAELWSNTTYSLPPPFTTTVSPTPVASSELVFPPALPARPMNDAPALTLPSDFIWGVASSAWQVEGGLQIEGRGPGRLDLVGLGATVGEGFTNAANDSNIADMNYFMYKQDIARLAALGIPYYSFSISWTRVVPFGVVGSPVNTQALEHYDDLINTCYEYGVTPIATLMHFDYPPSAFDDHSTFSENYMYYAKQVMTRYADRVPIWFTFNEPNAYTSNTGPGPDWNALSSMTRAHADVYHWYKEELKGTGRISLKFANNLALPLDPSNSSHVAAALRYQDFILGIMGNPIFLGEQYPEVALTASGGNLTALTEAELSYIGGTADFFAFDPYVPQFASPAPGGIDACLANPTGTLWPQCVVLQQTQENGWLMGGPSNAYPLMAPQYVRQQIGYAWSTFRPSGIMIAEFGFPQIDEYEQSLQVQQFDLDRSLYYQNFLTEMLHAVHADGVNMIGALAWSAFDNNEFGSYASQYGLQGVDRTDGKFERYYKRSLFDYVDFFNTHIEQ